MATPLHIKGSRTRVLNTLPSSSLGNDGDIVISRIKNKGVYLCTKAGGIWYAANQLQELRKIDKASISNLKANKLNISSLTDASKDTDTFIVSDKGQIGYRTGDELVDDLDIPVTGVDYKQAYCSLGQYTNKEDCEVNNGTWYYSDNDSHDSISSTAENELLTVASSLGKLDAEPTLLYDGSTLEIKRNSDFDDNWQTSAQDSLLKLSYDADNYCTFATIANGETTITTVDDGAATGHLTLAPDGDLNLVPVTYTLINKDTSGNAAENAKALHIDFDRTVALIGSNAHNDIGIDLDVNSASLGLSSVTGMDIDVVGATSGTHTATGIHCSVTNADTNIGMVINTGGTHLKLTAANDPSNDYATFTLADTGDLTIATVGDGTIDSDLTLQPDGNLILDPASGKTLISALGGLYFDGGSDTYIQESSADTISFVAGDDTILQLSESGGAGNLVNMGTSCAGFSTATITYNATDTLVYFSRLGNKAYLTFDGGDITDLHLVFPDMSGNFLLVIKQDATGSREIDYYKTFDQAVGNERTVYFAGGSNPTLTTTANKLDILSFFWNNDDHRAYGTITHNF